MVWLTDNPLSFFFLQVSIASAPEFVRLTDVISVEQPESPVHCTVSGAVAVPVTRTRNAELVAACGSGLSGLSDLHVLEVGGGQWMEHTTVNSRTLVMASHPHQPQPQVTALCVVGSNAIWCGDSEGYVSGYR